MRRFLVLIVALLAYGSLFPWNFDFTSTAGNPLVVLLHGWPTGWSRFVLRDAVLNIIIYTPLGLAAAFTARRKHSNRVAAALSVAFGFLFSVTMELLQVYVPGRDPSLADVLTNTIGCAAGAVFALYFETRLLQLSERRANQLRAASLLLLLVWMVSQLFPFLPDIGFTHLRQGLAVLLHYRTFSIVDTWAHCAEWFAVGLALHTAFARMRTGWLALAMLCIPAHLFVADRLLTLSEILGALTALALWFFVRPESRPRWCACMLASSIFLRQLQPFYFLAVPQPFSWVPFQATLMTNRIAAVVVIARKTFDFGAIIWALRLAGIPFLWAGLVVTASLAATEALQTYLPGRSPEITDPLLAVLLTLLLWAISRPADKARPVNKGAVRQAGVRQAGASKDR